MKTRNKKSAGQGKRTLVQAGSGKGKGELTSEVILSHPVFRDMAARLQVIHGMLEGLPKAIGAAVAEASRKPPEGSSGPPVPCINPGVVELSPRRLSVDGKIYELAPGTMPAQPREVGKPS